MPSFETNSENNLPPIITPETTAALVIRLIRRNEELEQQTSGLADTVERFAVAREIDAEQRERLTYLAYHDELTGLLSRTGLSQYFTRADPPKAVIYVDGTLKPVNDNLGHDRGDDVIRDTAEMLKKSLRDTDVAARIGGDEMVVLLDATPRSGQQVAARTQLQIVRDRLNILHAEYMQRPENQDIVAAGYDLAIGGAVWREGMELAELIASAETEMDLDKAKQYRLKGYER